MSSQQKKKDGVALLQEMRSKNVEPTIELFNVLMDLCAKATSSGAGQPQVSVVQCVAVWHSVLQCFLLCCSVLQCVAVCCSVLQCVVARCSMMQSGAVCCSGVAECCRELQCVSLQRLRLLAPGSRR